MSYPPGTTTRDLKRAGIIEGPTLECPECCVIVSEGEDHEEWCESKMDSEELAEYWAEEEQHEEYDPLEHKGL